MKSYRRTALITGSLFITATAASLLGTAVEQPIVTGGAGYLARVVANGTRLSLGGLLELIAAGASVGIAVSLYPVLVRWSEGLALGAVVFRAIEAVMYTVAALGLLALPAVGQEFTAAATSNRGSLQAIGDALMSLRQEAILAGVFAFVVGALMYYYVLFRSGLIPRWLSGWGIAAELLMLVACLSSLFTRNAITSYTVLVAPIAVQEMVLAVWLIARGFSSAVLQPERASQALAA